MSFFGSLDTSASALSAQRLRLDIISQNMANANTTRTEQGGAYKKKNVIFEEITNNSKEKFSNVYNRSKLKNMTNSNNNGVRVKEIVEDRTQGTMIYDPNNPDANEQGYVEQSNVNIIDEMVDMISASRSFEANVNAFNSTKSIFNKALEIGNK